MIAHFPLYISVFFGLTTLMTLFLFYSAVKNAKLKSAASKSNLILLVLSLWLIVQAVLTLNNVYNTETNSLPPKIAIFGVLPAILVVLLTFMSHAGRRFVDGLPILILTWINIVRVPVEITLYWLLLYKMVPELMTFTGRNFDILAGITAPFVAYYGIAKRKLGRTALLLWNLVCLLLLINIVVHAFLSAPSPLQKLAFEQPNIAILYFPISWLPTFIVPIILFGHLVSIRRLINNV